MTNRLGLLVGSVVLLATGAAHAEKLTVTGTGDGAGTCTGTDPNITCTTLRAAITRANQATGADTITLAAATYTLTDPNGNDDSGNAIGDLDINNSLTIVGSSASTTIITSNRKSRVFDIAPTSIGVSPIEVTLRNLKITSGQHVADTLGGGVRNHAHLTIDNCQLSGNYFAALYNLGVATIKSSAVQDNFGPEGAAVYNSGTLTIEDSDVLFNSQGVEPYRRGGAIFVATGTVVMRNVDLSSNGWSGGAGYGGALYLASDSANVTIQDSRLEGNEPHGANGVYYGGAIYQAAGTLSIVRTTMSANKALVEGGAIYMTGGTLLLDSVTANSNLANYANETHAAPPGFAGGGFLSASGDSTVTIRNSSFRANTFRWNMSSEIYQRPLGGAIGVRDLTGALRIENCRFNDNASEHAGGALSLVDGTGDVQITNSLFVGNSAASTGGAIHISRSGSAPIALTSLTIAGNSSGWYDIGDGGGLKIADGVVSLHNSVLAYNTYLGPEPDDLSGLVTSLGYNALQVAHGFVGTSTDTVGVDPDLTLSTSHLVYEPALTSFLVDGADPAGCLDPDGGVIHEDVLGNKRTYDGNFDGLARCDIGAVEVDDTSAIRFNAAVTISESAGTVTLSVTRSGTYTGPLTADFTTVDDTAIAGVDYQLTTGTLTWADAETTAKSIVVPIIGNSTDQASRLFTIAVTSPMANVPSPARITIADDDDPPNGPGTITLVTTTQQVPEGSTVTFKLQRVGGTGGSVSVSYRSLSGTAIVGRDVLDLNGTTTWPDGNASEHSLGVATIQDTEDEADEEYAFEIYNPTNGATLGTAVGTATILDDDTTPPKRGVLSVAAATYTAAEGGGNLTVHVQRTGGVDGTVAIDFALGTTGDTATAPADYGDQSGTLVWQNGDGADKTVSINIKDDGLDEPDELLTFRLRGSTISGGATLGSPATSAITITDDDLPAPAGKITIQPAKYTVGESAGMVTLTVKRVQGSNGQLDVRYYTGDGSATSVGLDYTPTSGLLSWTNGDTADKTILVPITGDSTFEADETFTVSLVDEGTQTPVAFGNDSATVTITNDDAAPVFPGVLSFGTASETITEGGTKVQLAVSRTGGSDGKVSVQCTSVDGTAIAPGDYPAVSRTLVWLDGDATDKLCGIVAVDDATLDPGEAFTLELSNPSGGATLGGIATAAISIIDNESPGTIVLDAAAYAASEADGSVNIVARRRGGAAGPASVAYAATAGTATASDFTATNGVLTWADGEAATKTFTIQLKKDALFESSETVNLGLTNATGATLGTPNTGVLTITDDDPQGGTLELQSATYAIAETGGTVTLKVARKGSTTGAVSVGFTTADESATAGSDYVASSNTLNWGAGVGGTQDIVLTITNDSALETDETFLVQLANNSATTALGRRVATVTILDNDAAPSTGTIALGQVTYTEKESGGQVALTATRTTGTGAASVTWQTAAGSATPDVDYVESSGSLSWGDGESGSKTIIVQLLDDTSFEGDETFTVTLSGATNGITLGAPSTATVTLKEDDAAPVTNGVLTFGEITFVVSEGGGTLQIPVLRVNGSTGAISVKCTTTPGSATAPADFTATDQTLTWTNGDLATKSCSIPINDNSMAESAESLTVTLNTPTGGATLASSVATVLIEDDDAAGQIRFAGDEYVVGEEDGSITITVNRVNGTDGAVDIAYTTLHRTAKGSDYTPTAGTLHWDDGDASPKTYVVPITSDFLYEGDEEFTNRLTAISGEAIVATQYRRVTIIDDDPPGGWLTLTKANFPVTEVDGSVAVLVNRRGTSSNAVQVSYTLTNQTATAGSDYTTMSGTLMWPAGDASNKAIVIPILDDTDVEGEETFQVKLSDATNGAAIERRLAKVTIADVEAAGLVSLSSATYGIGESAGALTVTATRTVSFGGAVSVDYALVSETATVVDDFQAASGILSWADGESGSKTFTVTIVSDDLAEGDETFSVELGNAQGGVGIGNSPATVTITDDDVVLDMTAEPADLAAADVDLASDVDASELPDMAFAADLSASSDLSLVDGGGVTIDQASPDQGVAAPKSGCGCSTAAEGTTGGALFLMLLVGIALRRPRERQYPA